MTSMSAELFEGPTSQVLRAVDQAAQLARWIRQHSIAALEKRDRTPLTIADLAAQAVVSHALEQAFPDDVLVAEEDASALQTDPGRALVGPLLHFLHPFLPSLTPPELSRLLNRGGDPHQARVWVLDPVDGTEGFLRSNGHYVAALALIEHGRPTLGILGCPTLDIGRAPDAKGDAPGGPHGSLLVARKGSGAWVTPLEIVEFGRVRVSDATTLRDARAVQSFIDWHIDVATTRAFLQAAEIERPPRRIDSQAKHALIAAGDADLFVRIPGDRMYREQVWDHAAGALIVEEAGGRVTDLDGRPLDFSTGSRLLHNEGVIASNGVLHPAILVAMQTARAWTTVSPPRDGVAS